MYQQGSPSALPHLAVWPGIKQALLFCRCPLGCFMSGPQKSRFYKVFHQFFPGPSGVKVFGHYYPISAAVLTPPSVRTSGDTVSVLQYTTTAEEAATLLSAMPAYANDQAFLSLPQNPAFNGGQFSLF
jgi:hypothetical protein